MLGKVLVLIGSSAGHCGMWESWERLFCPLWEEEENMQRWTQKSQRVVQTKQNRLAASNALLVPFSQRWEDEAWVVGGVGGLGTCYLFLCQFFLNPLTSAQTLVACIPTYRVDVCQPISEAKAAEPTQDCRPSPAHLLPSRPALALDQRQATRRGTGLMMATAIPSLSSPNPRVQFWLMLFPADKMQTSSFYFFFLTRGLGGEGWVSSSEIVLLFHYQVLGFGQPLL